MSLAGQVILVTGATGFIGGRLVEVLIRQHGCRVRALVHNFTNASSIARFPVEMVPGDVCDEAAMTKAARGCDVIIHAAVGNAGSETAMRRATVQGTENVLKAGLAAAVQRVVHLSTISVYGMTPDGDLNENSHRGRLLDAYSRNKARAEDIALHYHRKNKLPVAIVQPTVVYGPFASTWTIGPLTAMRRAQVVVPEEGKGLCNAVYIDDVVDAIIRAASVPQAVGECFLVAGAEPVTWRDFYGAYEDMLGFQSTVSMTEFEFRKESRGHPFRDLVRDCVNLVQHPNVQRRIQATVLLRTPYSALDYLLPRRLRKHLKVLTTETSSAKFGQTVVSKPKSLPDKSRFQWMAAKTRVCIDKARRVLGYEPQFDFQAGMLRTRLWAEWASLLN